VRRFPAAGLLAAAVSGCFSPVGTARTLAPGATQFQAGIGAMALLDACAGHEEWCFLPPVPMPTGQLAFRVGVADGAEVGLSLAPTGPAVDGKLALLRTNRLAFALDPTVAPSFLFAEGVVFGLPLLADLELDPHTTLVMQVTTIPYVLGADDNPPPLLGLGAGLLFRVTDGFGFQPGVQWLAPVGRDEPWSLLGFGLGFVFGRTPARPGEPVRPTAGAP
jgi:hypothetical protein